MLNTAEDTMTVFATCEVLQEQVCGLVEQAKDCCSPCTGTVSRMLACRDETAFENYPDYYRWMDEQNCTRAQECFQEGLALSERYTEDASTTTRVIVIIACVILVSGLVGGGCYMFYKFGYDLNNTGPQGRTWGAYAGGVNRDPRPNTHAGWRRHWW